MKTTDTIKALRDALELIRKGGGKEKSIDRIIFDVLALTADASEDAPFDKAMQAARFVYKGMPMAIQALDYLQAVIDNPLPDMAPAARPAPVAATPAPDRRRCKPCAATRGGDNCWKCGTATFEPHPSCGSDPALPPIDRIRALAKEVGYAIGVHGSQQRDFDVIAAPWTDDAVGNHALMEYIAAGLMTENGPARIVSTSRKPLGRYAATIQMDGWYKQLDISVCPAAAPAAPIAEVTAVAEWVNEEQGFQYLTASRLPDGTHLYTHPAAEHAKPEPKFTPGEVAAHHHGESESNQALSIKTDQVDHQQVATSAPGIAHAKPEPVEQGIGLPATIANTGAAVAQSIANWNALPWARNNARDKPEPSALLFIQDATPVAHAKLADGASEREQFEAQPALDDYRPIRRNSETGDYTSAVVAACWAIWQAKGQQAGAVDGEAG